MQHTKNGLARYTLWILLLLCLQQSVLAEEKLKPYVLASQTDGEFSVVVSKTAAALRSAGFEVVGEYSPYKDAVIIVISNMELKKNAASSKHGGFGAMQRVSVSRVKDQIQVAFTNPVYMANVYRMKGDLSTVRQQLEKALGGVRDFGAQGIPAEDLREYHYQIFMPYFDDPYEIKTFDSHDEALTAVEAGLKAGWGGTSKVYRIDIPGKQDTVFGVAMTRECSADEFVMSTIDIADTRSTVHLPYELLVTGKEVIALHARFRIAQSFPDLSMAGSNSFISIMCSPGDIEEALSSIVNGEPVLEEDE